MDQYPVDNHMEVTYCYGGEDWQVAASLTDLNGSGVNLTSATIYWGVAKRPMVGSSTVYLFPSQTISGTSGGYFSGTYPAASTTNFSQGTYFEEVFVSGTEPKRFQRYRVVLNRVIA